MGPSHSESALLLRPATPDRLANMATRCHGNSTRPTRWPPATGGHLVGRLLPWKRPTRWPPVTMEIACGSQDGRLLPWKQPAAHKMAACCHDYGARFDLLVQTPCPVLVHFPPFLICNINYELRAKFALASVPPLYRPSRLGTAS